MFEELSNRIDSAAELFDTLRGNIVSKLKSLGFQMPDETRFDDIRNHLHRNDDNS